MPTLECRVSRLEDKMSKQEVSLAAIVEKLDGVGEVLHERRRQADRTSDILELIQQQISDMDKKLFGYRSTALAVLRTTIVMTTFFSAVGAGIWAIVTLIFNEVKE